jgi:cytochrome P450
MSADFDPFVLGEDPFPAFAAARAHGGALIGVPAFPELQSTLYLFSHRLVSSALKHPLLLQAPPGTYQAVRQSLIENRVHAVLARSLLLADPPQHALMRKPLNQAVTPAKATELTKSLRADALALATRLGQRGRFDAVRDYAAPLLLDVLGRLLGMVLPDTVFLKTATASIARAIDFRRGAVRDDEFRLLEAEIEKILAQGKFDSDGLVAVMLAEEAAGRWEHEDVVANLLLLLFAGQETTIDAFGNALMALDAFPEQRALLDRGAVDWSLAVEELLRFGTPILYGGIRIAAADLDIEGVAVPAGRAIMPVLASANRDVAVAPQGDALRLDAVQTLAGMTFGSGFHVCLGRHVARVELMALLEALFRIVPKWRLDRAAIRMRDTLAFRGVISAPVTVDDPATI